MLALTVPISVSGLGWQPTVRWSLTPDMVGGGRVAIEGDRVIVAATRGGPKHAYDGHAWVHARDRATGAVLWEQTYNESGGVTNQSSIGALDADRGIVLAAGRYTGLDRWLVRAHDLDDGTVLWEHLQAPDAESFEYAETAVLARNRAVVAGTVWGLGLPLECIVRGYHARTGRVVWEDRIGGGACRQITRSTTFGGRVLVGYRSHRTDGKETASIRAYRAGGGRFLWEREMPATAWSRERLTGEGRVVGFTGQRRRPGGWDDVVQVLRARDGRPMWRSVEATDGRGTLDLVLGGSLAVVTTVRSGKARAHGYTVRRGEPLWSSIPTPRETIAAHGTIVGDHVALAATEHRPRVPASRSREDLVVVLLDGTSGERVAIDRFDGRSIDPPGSGRRTQAADVVAGPEGFVVTGLMDRRRPFRRTFVLLAYDLP